ncbi:hypothetical protein [Caballeronia sp. Lep1P3]|uniref:hypothetical protein n=1 Tax=Caballeronia sp. Lep1P3 TaxID=2878150 RepID=UPI001FD3EAC7|nr:hypothetical protein [Caballeronia sp. Lep1P3]
MNLDDERQIILAHPLIFRKLESRLPRGERFECAPGWKAIIADLATGLEQIARESSDEPVAVEQVKQKLGSLRVYLAGPTTEAAETLVDGARERSLRTCELCGAPGTLTGVRHRICVLCDQCALPSRKETLGQ